jgi:hypothetical protein
VAVRYFVSSLTLTSGKERWSKIVEIGAAFYALSTLIFFAVYAVIIGVSLQRHLQNGNIPARELQFLCKETTVAPQWVYKLAANIKISVIGLIFLWSVVIGFLMTSLVKIRRFFANQRQTFNTQAMFWHILLFTANYLACAAGYFFVYKFAEIATDPSKTDINLFRNIIAISISQIAI